MCNDNKADGREEWLRRIHEEDERELAFQLMRWEWEQRRLRLQDNHSTIF